MPPKSHEAVGAMPSFEKLVKENGKLRYLGGGNLNIGDAVQLAMDTLNYATLVGLGCMSGLESACRLNEQTHKVLCSRIDHPDQP
jgi:hypothetical protein